MIRRGAGIGIIVALLASAPLAGQVEGERADTILPVVDRAAAPDGVFGEPPPVSLPDTVLPIVDRRAQQQEPWTDAWGQEKNFGLAAAETVLGNFLPWAFNEIVPSRADLLISQISPRSWARGITHGFGWDDNKFSVNMFAHPFQGNIYFNSARGNGYNYWQSFLFAATGSYMWECCGESHLPSLNDWFMTSIGGAAVGEMLYRSSSMVLDNTATGSERAWREVGAFLLNPTRGFARLVTGNSSRVYDNPTFPNDRIPDRLANLLSFGTRIVGAGRLKEDTQAAAFLDMDLSYSSLLDLERQRPFDFFTLGVQLNFSDKQALGRLQIRGNLWHRDISDSDNAVSKFLIVQDFDYVNSNAYEFGGQSVGAMYLQRRRLTDRVDLVTEINGSYMIMGAVNSEFAFAADIPGIRERLREYDFGTGAGGRLGFFLLRDGYRWIDAEYRAQWLNTLNGSNENGEDAWHIVQDLRVRALAPVTQSWGIGVDADIFWRSSFFDFEEFDDVSQRSPQLRLFATWNPSRGG